MMTGKVMQQLASSSSSSSSWGRRPVHYSNDAEFRRYATGFERKKLERLEKRIGLLYSIILRLTTERRALVTRLNSRARHAKRSSCQS